jgi:hypothetical protein
VQARLHCPLAPELVLVAGPIGTHVFKQPISGCVATECEVLAIDVCGSNCTGGGGMF